jgi:Kef-type K+ transport system membrane component KefB/voltage-gated potassium channel Kch
MRRSLFFVWTLYSLWCQDVTSFSQLPKSASRSNGLHRKTIKSVPKTLARRTSTPPSRPFSALSAIPLDLSHDITSSISSLWVATESASASRGSEFEALGHDIFVFLAASVLVVPLCKKLNLSPVLGFIATGCVIGPFGFELFSNTEGDVQLGDLGILFLLFNEGLCLSPDRIKELGRFTGLGIFQLLLSMGFLFVATFWGGPVVLQYTQEAGIPLDFNLLNPVVENPIESFVIAAAGALSSSAFVLPVLKQKNWEERPEGIAGLSILLLQDLAVAPLLVIIPLLAGAGPSTSVELGTLVAKATVGFGVVLAAGSYVLRYVFDIVAATRSTETFVAAALLVAVGMGQTADYLGLSASTGAFAAGVLLAGNKYRAQIQADIKPFEGILLGIFFMTAGAELDPSIVINEWPVLLAGISAFIFIKAAIIFASGPALGLTKGQAARVSLTLAGGGEFALVLLQLAQGLGVLPNQLAKLLTASVVISMSLTPLLGELGAFAGNVIDSVSNEVRDDGLTAEEEADLFDQIDTDRSGSITLDELREVLVKLKYSYASIADVFLSFDTDGDGLIDRYEWDEGIASGLLAESLNTDSKDALRTDETFTEDALVIIGYGEVGKSIFNLLQTSECKSYCQGRVVCLDFNPSRVTTGVLEGAPVVFGDGARIELLKALGVTRPKAVIITLASDGRRLDATMRLRACLPEDTPIYVYEGNSRIGEELLEAGATEVISQTTETILRFGTLLGACDSDEEMGRLRKLSMNATGMTIDPNGREILVHGLSDEALMDLADEIGISQRKLIKTWEDFNSIADDRDAVPISELKAMMMLSSEEPTDGENIDICLSVEDEDGRGELTFVEYAKALWMDCALDIANAQKSTMGTIK